jgi:hypothetical protein
VGERVDFRLEQTDGQYRIQKTVDKVSGVLYPEQSQVELHDTFMQPQQLVVVLDKTNTGGLPALMTDS